MRKTKIQLELFQKFELLGRYYCVMLDHCTLCYMQKCSTQGWTQGQATKEEVRNVAQACKEQFQESQSSS